MLELRNLRSIELEIGTYEIAYYMTIDQIATLIIIFWSGIITLMKDNTLLDAPRFFPQYRDVF